MIKTKPNNQKQRNRPKKDKNIKKQENKETKELKSENNQ